MEKRQMLWKTKGMNKDLSVSAFNPEFAFENMNLRLSTNEKNTLMSWVNEKGTEELILYSDITQQTPMVIEGIPIGTAVIDHKLVLFTTTLEDPDSVTPGTDRIYVIEKEGDAWKGNLLFTGNLKFDTQHPLETLVSYEMEDVQKVYWTDGKNQPRVINIEGRVKEGVDTQFDFVPALGLKESIEVSKSAASGGGLFAPGVIQYGFTYVNKYGQESNMVMVSPIQYLSHVDRGASPDEMVTDSFTITINDVDQNFDYLRLYSIHRSSLNDVPQVKMLEELQVKITKDYIPYAGTDKVLPIRDGIAIERISIKGGTSTINIPTSHHFWPNGENDVTLEFIGYNDPDTIDTDSDTLITLKSILENTENYSSTTFFTEDYAYIDITHSLLYTIKAIPGVETGEIYNFVGFRCATSSPEDEDIILFDELYGGIRFVYNFHNCKWYISPQNSTITVNDTLTGTQYVDNGITGVSVDPESLLFVGGKEISALTLMEKDNTLFLGNIEEKNSSVDVIQNYFSEHPASVSFKYVDALTRDEVSGFYSYTFQLGNDRRHITTFKGGEKYRFGFQLQKYTGEWSEPIFLKDILNTKYPDSSVYTSAIKTAAAEASITVSNVINTDIYKKIRPLVVYPTIGNRQVICQGVLNPTVFNIEDRKQKLPYSQASWYFRPYMATIDNTNGIKKAVEFVHYNYVHTDDQIVSGNVWNKTTDAEIQGSVPVYASVFDNSPDSDYTSNNQFFVDQSIVTLNSPDIEFDTEVQSIGLDGVSLRIIGAVPITGNVSAHKINISSAMVQKGFNVSDVSTAEYGSGELDDNVQWDNIDVKAGNRLLYNYLWEDSVFTTGASEATQKTDKDGFGLFAIYPWQRTGPLNNDHRGKEGNDGRAEAASWLAKKKESNLLYSINTEYFSAHGTEGVDFRNNLNIQLHLKENSFIENIRLPQQKPSSSDINYYANIDKILTTTKSKYFSTDGGNNWISKNGYIIYYKYKTEEQSLYQLYADQEYPTALPISMKYKSGSHAVIALDAVPEGETDAGKIYILPRSGSIGEYTNGTGNTFWGDADVLFHQDNISVSNLFKDADIHMNHNWLWLGELYRNIPDPFGGTGREAILANNWVVGGDAIDLLDSQGTPKLFVTLRWTEGDTYFQRYDCLKTYPFSPEDTNQLVEILSFMVETHVNIDGRYDKNRGQQVSYNMTPENFNLMNYVYSQQDNFFTYKKVDIDGENKRHPNQIAYSLTKTPGADVDLWTNVNMGSVLELDGDKGEITKLMRLNDQLLAFQDSGISQILYNENVQISTEQGVPIEIANSGKVQGARYLSNTIGCSNKWSMAQTPAGIYFMDSNDKSIYLLGEGLKNVTLESGFNTWAKQEIKKGDGFKAFYDKLNQEVLFINQDRALAWSEKMGAFTSFYSYGGAPYFVNLDDEGLWVNKDNGTSGTNETDGAFKLWKHQGGDYGKFFGVNEPYWTILVGNPNPQMDKTFTNLEFRACVDGDGVIPAGETSGTVKFYPTLPFDSLEVWNEYQHGEVTLELRNGQAAAKHHTNDGKAGLNRKFRIWRCDIPRDNWDVCLKPDPLPVDPAPTQEEIAAYEEAMTAYNDEIDKGIYRYSKHPLDRMRNPWLYLKLMKEAATDALQRTEVHDMMMSYFV